MCLFTYLFSYNAMASLYFKLKRCHDFKYNILQKIFLFNPSSEQKNRKNQKLLCIIKKTANIRIWKLLNPGGIKFVYLALFTNKSLNQVYFVQFTKQLVNKSGLPCLVYRAYSRTCLRRFVYKTVSKTGLLCIVYKKVSRTCLPCLVYRTVSRTGLPCLVYKTGLVSKLNFSRHLNFHLK